MLELSTPIELIEKTIELIENERKVQKLQQKELALKADIPFSTYKDFVYKKKKTFFKFLDASGNIEENKKELFLRYMESESFKEVDNKFKELIMSASN